MYSEYIKQKAEEYRENLKQEYGTKSAKFLLYFMQEYNRPLMPNESNEYFESFHKKKRDSLAAVLQHEFDSIQTFLHNIEERLLIRELVPGGGMPDPRFYQLMDYYFQVNPDRAFQFCLSRWRYNEFHKSDEGDYKEVPYTKNVPYVHYLLERYPLSTLIQKLFFAKDVPQMKNLASLLRKELAYRGQLEYVQNQLAILISYPADQKKGYNKDLIEVLMKE